MLFVEARFFFFFAVVFCVHWSLRSHRLRKMWLLVCSYVFYGAWNWKFLSLILISTGVDYLVGRMLGTGGSVRRRKLWLTVSVVVNLSLLSFFKYFNWFAESAAALLTYLGLHTSPLTLDIVLPVGISFYTFQTMSYTIDVYRGQLKPVRDFFDFAMYVAFFPQLVAGPIVRAVEFLPQLDRNRSFVRHVAVRASLTLFLIGFFKKACLADTASIVVDRVFADPAAFSPAGTWTALALYAIQIYGDFSGYSDMAIATAGLLGYRLTVNFDFPFFAPSIGEFWRRWHISLTMWIRDYLYIPLGGSRVPWGRLCFNVFFTMALCGLWHGAGWQYVTFGVVHAAFLFINRAWHHFSNPRGLMARALRYTALPLTFVLLMLSWTIFRTESFANTLTMLRVCLFVDTTGTGSFGARWVLFWLACVVLHWVSWRGLLTARIRALPDWLFALLYGATWAAVLPLVASGYKPFMYFQF